MRLFEVRRLRRRCRCTASPADVPAENRDSTWTGVYWAISTMTTVGYGDVKPETQAGRAIAVAVMLVGIGFLTLVIGAIAQRFMAAEVEEIEKEEGAKEFESVEEALHEIREVMSRLQRLETAVQRLGQG
ncbi:MAG: two pore domain potassium channel family protein [Actinobacteria bacterium]|nr:MAG: two pore domain potassium channel family protein [Actinomycetota bacterium]